MPETPYFNKLLFWKWPTNPVINILWLAFVWLVFHISSCLLYACNKVWLLYGMSTGSWPVLSKTGSYSKSSPVFGGFCTGPVMGRHILTFVVRILPWKHSFKYNSTSEVCSTLPSNSNQAETSPRWTWSHSIRLENVALVAWMSSNTGKKNVKSQKSEAGENRKKRG